MKNQLSHIKKVFHHLDMDQPFSVIGGQLNDCRNFVYGDSHYSPQLVIILSGQQEVYYPDYRDIYDAGQIWWTSCWEPHVHRITSDRLCYVAVTIALEAIGSFTPFQEIDWLQPFFLPPAKRPKTKDDDLRNEIIRLGNEILQLENNKPFAFQTLQWLKIHEVILHGSSMLQHTSRTGILSRHSDIARIAPAIQLVKSKLDQVISLEQAASSCSLSKSRFSDVFTKTMNVGFSNFAQRMRISAAAQMLQNSNLPIKKVAVRCGFRNISHFYHIFKENFKCTPAEFSNRRH